MGVIYPPGNEIEIQATLVNAASGRTVRSFDTLRRPRHEVDSSLDTWPDGFSLRSWKRIILLFVSGLETASRTRMHREVHDRLAHVRASNSEAKVHLCKALELDPHF